MKFSPKCRTKKLGMIYTIWEVFAYFLIWEVFACFLIGKGPIFSPKSGLGKSLTFLSYILLKMILTNSVYFDKTAHKKTIRVQ